MTTACRYVYSIGTMARAIARPHRYSTLVTVVPSQDNSRQDVRSIILLRIAHEQARLALRVLQRGATRTVSLA